MKTLVATRYVTPLREGGSLPAIVEASDDGLYVLKFRAAGQGAKALVAELVAGELARVLGLQVPELAFVELPRELGRNEPDYEIRELLRASHGLNLGMDYLPGSITFDPVAGPAPDADVASAIVWFDAFVTNVDRTAKNPNLLWWHRRLWVIDHGAALYFHHDWEEGRRRAATPFAPIRQHVLLPWATRLREVAGALAARLTREAVERVVSQVPDAWLAGEARFASAAEHRAAYVDWLLERRDASDAFVEEAIRARSLLV